MQPFFDMIQDHLQNSDNHAYSIQISQATDDVLAKVADMLSELKTDIAALAQSLAAQVTYQNFSAHVRERCVSHET